MRFLMFVLRMTNIKPVVVKDTSTVCVVFN